MFIQNDNFIFSIYSKLFISRRHQTLNFMFLLLLRVWMKEGKKQSIEIKKSCFIFDDDNLNSTESTYKLLKAVSKKMNLLYYI
jgi:hypothetical protein